jgi:hypothetical protein
MPRVQRLCPKPDSDSAWQCQELEAAWEVTPTSICDLALFKRRPRRDRTRPPPGRAAGGRLGTRPSVSGPPAGGGAGLLKSRPGPGAASDTGELRSFFETASAAASVRRRSRWARAATARRLAVQPAWQPAAPPGRGGFRPRSNAAGGARVAPRAYGEPPGPRPAGPRFGQEALLRLVGLGFAIKGRRRGFQAPVRVCQCHAQARVGVGSRYRPASYSQTEGNLKCEITN